MSKITRNKLFILGVVCGLIMCISGIYAFTNTQIFTVKNEVNTGAIKIELKEYTVQNGQELVYTDSETLVLPGQIISLIPRISNIGDSSYVRAKLLYTSEDDDMIQISDDNVEGMDDNWVKKGSYWYYKNIVNSGESVDVFKSLRIPIDVPNEFQGKSIHLNIIAEAVQANNFNPNFDSNSPWNDIEAKKSNTTYQADMVKIGSGAIVEYENSANLYLDVPENFFNKLGHVMPGDSISEKVFINNKKETSIEYFVSTVKPDGVSEEGLGLLKKLHLKIVSGDGVIYDGTLYNLENVSLGTYVAKSKADVEFIVTVPSELGNEYANITSAIKWNFSVSEAKKEAEPEKEPEKKQEEPKPASPQTGDTKFIIAIAVFIISAVGLIVVLILEKKQKNKNK